VVEQQPWTLLDTNASDEKWLDDYCRVAGADRILAWDIYRAGLRAGIERAASYCEMMAKEPIEQGQGVHAYGNWFAREIRRDLLDPPKG
jgi:hypothetical protein